MLKETVAPSVSTGPASKAYENYAVNKNFSVINKKPVKISRKNARKHGKSRRICLSCQQLFNSEGIHNRICGCCKHRGNPPAFEIGGQA